VLLVSDDLNLGWNENACLIFAEYKISRHFVFTEIFIFKEIFILAKSSKLFDFRENHLTLSVYANKIQTAEILKLSRICFRDKIACHTFFCLFKKKFRQKSTFVNFRKNYRKNAKTKFFVSIQVRTF
jgi:hypothetical protein